MEGLNQRERAEEGLKQTQESFYRHFEGAPVMMHAVDEDRSLVKVNRSWLDALGYEQDEVLGRKSTDFLTDESRLLAASGALPLLWQVGSARSVGNQFARKDGGVLDVLVDAEICPAPVGEIYAYAAIRGVHDRIQWEQAADTIKELQELARTYSRISALLQQAQTIPAEVFYGVARLPNELTHGRASSYLGIEMEVDMEQQVITGLSFSACPELCVDMLQRLLLGQDPVVGVGAAKLAIEERYHGPAKRVVIAALDNTILEYQRSTLTTEAAR